MDEDTSKIAGSASPTCPECGGAMVTRTARRGRNAGGRFWGCLKYPKCKGTVDATGATAAERVDDADARLAWVRADLPRRILIPGPADGSRSLTFESGASPRAFVR